METYSDPPFIRQGAEEYAVLPTYHQWKTRSEEVNYPHVFTKEKTQREYGVYCSKWRAFHGIFR